MNDAATGRSASRVGWVGRTRRDVAVDAGQFLGDPAGVPGANDAITDCLVEVDKAGGIS